MLFLMSLIFMMLSLTMFMKSTFISLNIPILMFNMFSMKISILMDWYSMIFQATILFITSMILMFSLMYIPINQHFRFSMLLLMFVLSMSLLIFSNNFIFMLLGWDGLGLTSYILVIYYQNPSSNSSGTMTILSNRVGDILILLSIALLMSNMTWKWSMNYEYPLMVMILLTMASLTKSAQFPFSAWLPAAMAAPTPISALVHSSTLVTAGVFLLMRVINKFHQSSMTFLLCAAVITSCYASFSANWEQDMKKIIALSTLSQIAMMMFAISMGATNLAFFHLIVHAMFKSMMFLCAGAMIHMSSYQDMRMSNLSLNNTPIINSMLGLSSMTLMALPFTSGFFSKDMIIQFMFQSKLYLFLSILMLTSLGMTVTYNLRLIKMLKTNMHKIPPENLMNTKYYSDYPILLMALFPIMLGSSMLWTFFPTQILIFSNSLLLFILLTMMSGGLLGILTNFNSMIFKNLGELSISLIFIHFMTTWSNLFSPNLMNLLMSNDKMWQETYGPKHTYINIKIKSIVPELSSNSFMFILLLITIIPISIIILFY